MSLTVGHNVVMFMILFVLCFIGTDGRASLSFNLPSIGPFGQNEKKDTHFEFKQYSGRRIDKNSIRMVYFNDQTVAIVELGPHKLLLNCELIEVPVTKVISPLVYELKGKDGKSLGHWHVKDIKPDRTHSDDDTGEDVTDDEISGDEN